LFSLLPLLAGCSPDLTTVSRVQQTQAAFERAQSREDFLRVADQYQQLRDEGFASGALLYNQGNAYMRAGEPGRAVACYRQAQRYLPRDPYLDANLRLARGGAPAGTRPLVQYLLFWQDWISYPAKFHGTGLAALVSLLCGVAALLGPRAAWWRRLAWFGWSVTLLLAVSAAYDWYRHTQVTHAVVIQAEVVARKGDADSYEPAFTGPLPEATELTVQEQRGRWLRVRLKSGQEGWVRRQAVVLY
jgi:hypothetical protein